MTLIEAIEYHGNIFHETKDEWSLKMLKRLLKLLSERDGIDSPDYLKLLKRPIKEV